MRTMVGSSILPNGFDAGVEIAKNSTKGLKTPVLGFLFTSELYDHAEVLNGIKSVTPGIKVIGCTSSGAVMTPDGIISSADGYGAMMVLDDNELSVGVASAPRGTDPRMTGRKLAKEALDDAGKKFAPYAFAMFATPGEEEDYLKGIQDVIGEIPMFGGTCSDNNLSGEWKVFDSENVQTDGCAVVFFYTNKDIKNVIDGTYNETESIGIITETDNNRMIKTIDGEPSLEKYASWIGEEVENIKGTKILTASVAHPLGLKTLDGEMTIVRHPLVGNEEGTISLGADVSSKTAVMLLESDEDGLIGGVVQTVKQVLSNFQASGLLLIHSSERKNYIGERIDEDFVAIKNAVGDIPFIVAFTLAEYGQKDHSGAKINNLSLSFTGFSEN